MVCESRPTASSASLEIKPQPPFFNVNIVDGSNGVTGYEPLGSGSPLPQGAASSSNSPSNFGAGTGGSTKRKRGRPRKYGPDGKPILTATPVPTSPASAPRPSTGAYYVAANVGATSAAEKKARGRSPGSTRKKQIEALGNLNVFNYVAANVGATSAAEKKARGRPPGSTRKKQIEALGSAGYGFMPHLVTVNIGEDVLAKIMDFSQQSSRAICILSANGAISNVTLRQPGTSGGIVTYEGHFEILSLSGSFLLSASGGQSSRIGGLSVSLAGQDGHVLGGGVAGHLTAASPVQIILSSFTAYGKMETETINASGIAPGSGNLSIPGNAMGTDNPPTGSCYSAR